LESGVLDIGRKSLVKCSRSIAGLNIVFPFQSLWHAVNCRKMFAVGHSLKKGADAIWQHLYVTGSLGVVIMFYSRGLILQMTVA
jgi:hypothetical protein